ncbi:hypothetical protein O533_00452 [Staphylococcus aureus M0448]|nr:hypothetical protein B962_02632 [Staphylococcus aureus M0404]EUY45420.1 hypothetical protein O502_01095 [Staphylococcus aureus M0405]EUY52921.1 hypothetical protein O504_01191 [Staphylococcus aureus M0409]EUZ20982.1 hypothetical protein O533_00452 [Staphylococcus aureus M0448]EUZ23560.1 hypothetical protein O535_01292 [Staphylococcus aureus M0451]EUZ25035.1 hypothetical protein O534_00952 [Staphylococcus aureus M0449]EVB69369.1 hypothetical protein O633_01291 [Staphylococcus aureus M0603]
MTVFVMQLQSNLKSIEELISQSRWSYKKPRTVNYRYNQDKLMHRLGDILVQYGIQHDTGLLPHEWHYHISPRGKADIVQHNRDGQPIYVSLSYSYPYIVCVVDKEPVGIDIEKISQR